MQYNPSQDCERQCAEYDRARTFQEQEQATGSESRGAEQQCEMFTSEGDKETKHKYKNNKMKEVIDTRKWEGGFTIRREQLRIFGSSKTHLLGRWLTLSQEQDY